MDWQIRIALVIAGVLLLGFIYYDFNRRKKKQDQQQRLIDNLRKAAESVDSEGYDINGVGNVRSVSATGSDLESSNIETNVSEEAADIKNSINTTASSPVEQIDLPVEQMDLIESSEKNIEQESNQYIPKQDDPTLVISLILQAKENQAFRGKDFMPAFLSQGLRHGEMNIFHRHSGFTGKDNQKLYSVANAIQPGTISIQDIERFETPAFAFFINLPGPNDPISAYQGMIKSIQFLAKELDGLILDGQKNIFDQQAEQAYLELLQNYVSQMSVQTT